MELPYRNLESCRPLSPEQHWPFKGVHKEAPLEQDPGQGGLYITCSHKIWELVKGEEESGFYFAFGCGLDTLVEGRLWDDFTAAI